MSTAVRTAGPDVERVLARGVDTLPAGSPARAVVDAALDHYRGGLRIAVTGRPGVGRDTMAAALSARLAVSAAPGLPRPDLWCHVLAGPVRDEDRRLLAAVDVDRLIVVLGRADTVDAPAALATRCAAELGIPVFAVSALWAVAALDDADVAFLRRLALLGRLTDGRPAAQPPLAAHFASPTGVVGDGVSGVDERTLRTGLLRRIDRRGIDTALALIARTADGAPSDDGAPPGTGEIGTGVIGAGEIVEHLARASGFEEVRAAITAHMDAVRGARVREVCRRLDRVAAAGGGRDVLESMLRELAPRGGQYRGGQY